MRVHHARGRESNHNRGSGGQCRLGTLTAPARLDQLGWIGSDLAAPMCNVALLIFYIEIKLRMRIGVTKLRDGGLGSECLGIIVGAGSAVVRKKNGANEQQTCAKAQSSCRIILHVKSLRTKFYHRS